MQEEIFLSFPIFLFCLIILNCKIIYVNTPFILNKVLDHPFLLSKILDFSLISSL